MGRYSSSYNLLFADVLIITIPMLILFLFFNKKIVDGMVAGAVKGCAKKVTKYARSELYGMI